MPIKEKTEVGISTAITPNKKGKYTVEDIKQFLPKGFKGAVTQNCVDMLNNLDSDPNIAEEIKERFISYSNILNSGRYKLSSYIAAVKFVSLKLIDYTDKDAYIKTFPDRYKDMIARGYTNDDIAKVIHIYRKGQLVVDLMTQVQIPSWVLNQDKVQVAINTLAEICVSSKSDRARVQAADSLLTHLQRPEEAAPALQINTQVNINGIEDLKNSLSELVVAQKNALAQGVPLSKIIQARPKVIEADIEEEDNGDSED